MTISDSPPPVLAHPPFVSHVEWRCTDLQKTASFFQALFGWHFDTFGDNYMLYTPGQGTCVGLLQTERVAPGNDCLVFIQVPSIATSLRQALDLDSKVLVPKKSIPNYGWYAQISDPDQNPVGLFEPLNPNGA
ncbi:MAG: hypothetical protein OEZ68_04180 [Gammaproteobacteria bacterium]|nr:hypothetical protein [Gammaproteobacteria bacterium]MDH5799985.1 hypothetical protein [Gammaproteobacteria bacterium]